MKNFDSFAELLSFFYYRFRGVLAAMYLTTRVNAAASACFFPSVFRSLLAVHFWPRAHYFSSYQELGAHEYQLQRKEGGIWINLDCLSGLKGK